MSRLRQDTDRPLRTFRQTFITDLFRTATLDSDRLETDCGDACAGAESEAVSAEPTSVVRPEALFVDTLEKHRLRYFPHITAYSSQQQEGIRIGCDAMRRDMVVVMPTGGGKSAVYQCAALQSRGVTLVISPLLALIDDQLRNLEGLGTKAACLKGKLNKKTKAALMDDLGRTAKDGGPQTKLLYMAPETALSKGGQQVLHDLAKNLMLARIVVDEAHCVRYESSDRIFHLVLFRESLSQVNIYFAGHHLVIVPKRLWTAGSATARTERLQ